MYAYLDSKTSIGNLSILVLLVFENELFQKEEKSHRPLHTTVALPKIVQGKGYTYVINLSSNDKNVMGNLHEVCEKNVVDSMKFDAQEGASLLWVCHCHTQVFATYVTTVPDNTIISTYYINFQ